MARSLGVRFPVEVDDVRPPRHQEDLHSPARDKRAVVLIWMFAVDISVVTFDRLIEAEEQYYCSVERDSISPACLVLTQGDIAKYFQSSVVCLNDLTTLFLVLWPSRDVDENGKLHGALFSRSSRCVFFSAPTRFPYISKTFRWYYSGLNRSYKDWDLTNILHSQLLYS